MAAFSFVKSRQERIYCVKLPVPDFELRTTDNLSKEGGTLYDDADHRGNFAGAGLLTVGRKSQPLQCRVLGVGSGRSEGHDVLGQAVEFEFMGKIRRRNGNLLGGKGNILLADADPKFAKLHADGPC